MILILILVSLLLICSFISAGTSIRDKEWGALAFSCFLAVMCGILLWADIDAMVHHNKQNVEYRFPADHYQMFEEVTVSYKTIYLNGIPVMTEDRDTTYIIVGEEPIIIEDNHYKRKALKDE